MITRKIAVTFALAMPLFAACADETSTDELAGDDGSEGDAKADATGMYTYYFVERADPSCTGAECMGWYYRLANASTTKCHDGNRYEFCAASSIDWTSLGLTNNTIAKMSTNKKLLVRATVGPVGDETWFPTLAASEAWIAVGPKGAHGPIVKVNDSNRHCAVAPCPTLRERKLNATAEAYIAELDWAQSDAEQGLIDAAVDRLASDAVIVAGYRYTTDGQKARSVTQFWVRATDDWYPQ